jgi:enoyl-[acyl-carrier protein] reductase I
MGFLANKRVLLVGVASNRSIAWGIAQAMHREGAALAFTYQNHRLKSRVEKLAGECDSDIVIPCDVEDDRQIEDVFERLDDYWDYLDVIVHSVAFAPRETLEGDFLDNITRDGFRMAHDISSYSLTALARCGRCVMRGRKGALLTLTYLGATRAMPNYNVMGLAKASLEANGRHSRERDLCRPDPHPGRRRDRQLPPDARACRSQRAAASQCFGYRGRKRGRVSLFGSRFRYHRRNRLRRRRI